MHTALVILGGFVLLGLCLLAGRWMDGAGTAALVGGAKIFIPLWLVAAGINMWIGVARAGYSAAEEFPIFLVIFALPAAVAAFLWWRYSGGTGI